MSYPYRGGLVISTFALNLPNPYRTFTEGSVLFLLPLG